MNKYFLLIIFLILSSNSFADSLGTNKTINDYLSNGYQLQSISVIDQNKLVYNLLNNGSEEKIFEPKLISCVYNTNTQLADCFKP